MGTDDSIPADLELVRRIAWHLARHLPRCVDRDELVSLGNLGLVEARKRFDAKRGVPFAAYAATRIRGAILDGLRKVDPLPRARRALARGERQLTAQTCFVHDRRGEPTSSDTRADEALEVISAVGEVYGALEALPARERDVVRDHFLLERPLKQIGSELGVSESRVCQILTVALKRLRAILDAPTLSIHANLEAVR